MSTKKEREERQRRRRHHRLGIMYGTAGYGYPYLGWTAQQAMNPEQFGTAATPTGDMTTTPGGGDGGAPAATA